MPILQAEKLKPQEATCPKSGTQLAKTVRRQSPDPHSVSFYPRVHTLKPNDDLKMKNNQNKFIFSKKLYILREEKSIFKSSESLIFGPNA